LTDDDLISIIINEEDHLRVGVFCPDLNFKAMFDKIYAIDDHVSEDLNITFDKRIRFLIACRTNGAPGM
jgi:protein arginine kinase